MALMALLLLAPAAQALVNPDEIAQELPPWYVGIYVLNEATGRLSMFCKGSLIDPQWVLSAYTCGIDAYKVLGGDKSLVAERLFVKVGASAEFVGVREFIQHGEQSIALLQLEEKIATPVLPLSARRPGELEGENLVIAGSESSRPAGDILFNPKHGQRMRCSVDGKLFGTDDALCYIVAYPEAASTAFRSAFRAINPHEFSGLAYLEQISGPYDPAGDKLFLEHPEAASYPCYEDLGAPVLAYAEDGSVSQVAVVTRVGLLSGTPVCSGHILSEFTSVAYVRDLIERTKAQSYFSGQCPPELEVEYEYLSATRIRLFWDSLPEATGYKVHYTLRLGYFPIQTIPVENQTEYVMDLVPDWLYSIRVSAHNDRCGGPLSETLTLYADQEL
jgi:hypothetical protein